VNHDLIFLTSCAKLRACAQAQANAMRKRLGSSPVAAEV
jgi:hypothetical protein